MFEDTQDTLIEFGSFPVTEANKNLFIKMGHMLIFKKLNCILG